MRKYYLNHCWAIRFVIKTSLRVLVGIFPAIPLDLGNYYASWLWHHDLGDPDWPHSITLQLGKLGTTFRTRFFRLQFFDSLICLDGSWGVDFEFQRSQLGSHSLHKQCFTTGIGQDFAQTIAIACCQRYCNVLWAILGIWLGKRRLPEPMVFHQFCIPVFYHLVPQPPHFQGGKVQKVVPAE